MRIWKDVLAVCVTMLAAMSLATDVCAEPGKVAPVRQLESLGAFSAPPGLRDRVDFWVLIFAKYGKNQSVFHFRQDPGIVYSVVDTTKLAESFGGAKFEKMKASALNEETQRIRTTLLELAAGKAAQSPFERRLERMFQKYGSRQRAKYKEAADPEQIRSQTRIRERFGQSLQRAPRYLYAIEQIFNQRGLPKEVGKLPYVESSFDYNAYSSVGAAGIWQFMRSTGRKYMRIDNYVDERRDPIIASRAAAEYLSHAHRVLGAWPLAITSYNHGVNGVLRAAKTLGTTDISIIVRDYEGESFGFASKNFYASFLAALQAERDREAYFPGLQREPPLLFDEVRLARPARYLDIERLSGASSEQFQQLNPALLRPVTSGRVPIPAGFLVKVPRGKGPRVVQAVPGSTMYSVLDAPLVHLRTGPDIQPRRGAKPVSSKKGKKISAAKKKSAPVKKAAPVKKSVKKRAK